MKPTESQIQQAFVEYVDRKHPLLSPFLIKITNEGKRSVVQGAKMKKEGLRKGVPDMFFAVPSSLKGTRGSGIWIEIKAPGKKPTKEQKEYLERFRDMGYFTAWYDNLDCLIQDFEFYIEGISQHG